MHTQQALAAPAVLAQAGRAWRSALRDAGTLEQGDEVAEHFLATCPLDSVLAEVAQAVVDDPGLLEYGTGLAQFRDDPLRDSWTLREGRPYGLVCTRNQASYEARFRQRVVAWRWRNGLLQQSTERG